MGVFDDIQELVAGFPEPVIKVKGKVFDLRRDVFLLRSGDVLVARLEFDLLNNTLRIQPLGLTAEQRQAGQDLQRALRGEQSERLESLDLLCIRMPKSTFPVWL